MSGVLGARQYVQNEKIQIAQRTITSFQYQERWPEKYNSFVASETKNNLYKESDKFFRVMRSKPEWYARKFIFRPLDAQAAKYIKDATILAHRIVIQQLQAYINAPNVSGTPNTTSGFYASMIRMAINDVPIQNVSELDNLNSNSVVSITDVAEYATRTESNALYFAGVGGVFYYAAQYVAKKFPMLSFRFSFVRAGNKILGRSAGPGSSFPVLLIGTRENVIFKLQKPRRETYNPRTGRRRGGYKPKYAPNATAANLRKA